LTLLHEDWDLEEELDTSFGDDDFVEHEAYEFLTLGEGHSLEPGGDLLAEVAYVTLQFCLCRTVVLFEHSSPFQLDDPVVQGALAALEVSQGDGARLVGVEQAALLGA
jgi:hypothetical protein